MWAEDLTKPLQGAKYKKFRGKLMNIPMEYDGTRQFLLNEDKEKEVTFTPWTKTGSKRSPQQRMYNRAIQNKGYSELQGCVGEQCKTDNSWA